MRRSQSVFRRPEHAAEVEHAPAVAPDPHTELHPDFQPEIHDEPAEAVSHPAPSEPFDAPQVPARAVLREWADALVIAIVIAMFLRMFIIELYQIPSGSMTPTLIGGEVLWTDYNGDGREDLLLLRDREGPLLFLNDGKGLIGQGEAPAIDPLELNRLRREHLTRFVYDRILVNKLAYWLAPPRRGDIVVFKIPKRIWDPLKSIYIKRVVGEPGETLTFTREGNLVAGGLPVTRPDFFLSQRYAYMLDEPLGRLRPEVEYGATPDGRPIIERIHVPRTELYVFGDNTWSSYDSRLWGGVPLDHVKGRAFFCYWPPERIQLFRKN